MIPCEARMSRIIGSDQWRNYEQRRKSIAWDDERKRVPVPMSYYPQKFWDSNTNSVGWKRLPQAIIPLIVINTYLNKEFTIYYLQVSSDLNLLPNITSRALYHWSYQVTPLQRKQSEMPSFLIIFNFTSVCIYKFNSIKKVQRKFLTVKVYVFPILLQFFYIILQFLYSFFRSKSWCGENQTTDIVSKVYLFNSLLLNDDLKFLKDSISCSQVYFLQWIFCFD